MRASAPDPRRRHDQDGCTASAAAEGAQRETDSTLYERRLGERLGGNSYGHPHPPTLATLEQHDMRVFRTDRHGAITVISDGERYWVETFTAYAGSPPPVRIPPLP